MMILIIIATIEAIIAPTITAILIELLEFSELVVFTEEQVSFSRLKPFEHLRQEVEFVQASQFLGQNAHTPELIYVLLLWQEVQPEGVQLEQSMPQLLQKFPSTN
jgi:hypothetical protein